MIMIIEFTVSNFRSIKNEQTFCLYAENLGPHLVNNIAQPSIAGNINILKSVGIYGANASGKTNLFLAFKALQYLVVKSGSLENGDSIKCYEPYRLSGNTRNTPVRFEIEFVVPGGIRYRYKVAFLQNRIVEEKLCLYQTTKESLIFERNESDTWETVKFGALYKGGTKRFSFHPNNTYLSKTGDASAPQMIQDIYNYFRKDVINIGFNDHGASYSGLDEHGGILKKVSHFLALIDTGVTEVSILEKDIQIENIKFPFDMPEQLKEQFKARVLRKQKQQILFSHKTDTGETEFFEKTEESAGTCKMLDLALLVIDAFTCDDGGVLIIDELDNSMHPFMAELIIKLFNDPEVNPGKAQLIFSTHNINLMSPEYFRRDQIWFTEKSNGVSRFYSLDDFDKKKVTPASPFNRWYAEGRFGAVPKIDYQSIANLLKKESANAKT